MIEAEEISRSALCEGVPDDTTESTPYICVVLGDLCGGVVYVRVKANRKDLWRRARENSDRLFACIA